LDSCKELRTCHFLLCLFFNVLSNFTLARVSCFLGNGAGQMLSLLKIEEIVGALRVSYSAILIFIGFGSN